jgi:hypothetical protein
MLVMFDEYYDTFFKICHFITTFVIYIEWMVHDFIQFEL